MTGCARRSARSVKVSNCRGRRGGADAIAEARRDSEFTNLVFRLRNLGEPRTSADVEALEELISIARSLLNQTAVGASGALAEDGCQSASQWCPSIGGWFAANHPPIRTGSSGAEIGQVSGWSIPA